MTGSEFTEQLLRFIGTAIPTFPAAELLLFLSRHPDRQWAPEEIVSAVQPTVITTSAVKEYLALFQATGLVHEPQTGCFQYQPASVELEASVQALAQAYNERPVTLIRTIYKIADNKIQSFADSFRLKKD
jgi:hypothetical protein